jgi:predicted signal transduction protein with EAL and GGDEF domain
VCRLGGDEFVVLLPRVDGWEQACATAERLLKSVQQPLILSAAPKPVRIGASIGIAMYPGDGTEFDALVRAADVAMYRSKDLGRGRHSLYRPEMDAALQERLRLERELGDAVAQGQLRLYLQPMLDARDGRVLGAEALVRWQHPQQGLLGPDGFIGAAESTGAIRPLGQWVLEAACTELAAWRARGRQDLHVAVNVSALQLQDPAFVDIVLAAIRSRGLPPGALTLELTESLLLGDGGAGIGAVQALREAGVRLAIDDFGTGYSSLSALKRVRPDLLKIDRGFVHDLPASQEDCALAEAVLHMAAALGIKAVAEGVETPAQRDWLLSHGGWRQQGDLWARPMPAPEFRSRLQT